MEPVKRIIVNTIAQYTKAIINIGFSLYSTRLVLDALSINDYGIYALVFGITSILGFLTNAFIVTTQRYLSFYIGKGDYFYVKKLFANSLLIHVALGMVFCLILIFLQDTLINHYLDIAPSRRHAAGIIYYVMTGMLFFSIVSSPFKALLVTHENIVYISIVEVIDGFLKVMLALGLMLVTMDKLIAYSIGMATILFGNFLAFVIYVLLYYPESRVGLLGWKYHDKEHIRHLLSFAGWTTYSMIATICQTQGTSIVLNKFFGTAMNAAYGVGMQVNGAVRFVSTSILNAMNPQLMKAEGKGDRAKMLLLAGKESKFSTALMMIVAIPLMVEMNSVLSFWLREVPEHTSLFCRGLLIAFLVDQLTLGLHAANQATGKIMKYTIIMSTPKILYIPFSVIALSLGAAVDSVMIIYIVIELVVALYRIPFMNRLVGLDMRQYVKHVLLPLIPMSVVVVAVSLLASRSVVNVPYGFFITILMGMSVGVLAMWKGCLSKAERDYVVKFVKANMEKWKSM